MDPWRVQRVDPRRAELNLSSSAQGRATVTQLIADEEILANAIEFTTWRTDPVQVEVCSECGIERCASRGWVSPRRSGDRVLWIPPFDELEEDDEYGPPRYFAHRGVPLFEPEAAKILVATVGAELEDLPTLTSRDVALLLQWTAPGGLLGAAPGAPRFRREDVLAVSSGERDEVLDRLDALLAWAIDTTDVVVLRDPEPSVEPVGLFLDLPGYPEWAPLVGAEDRLELAFHGLRVALPST